MSASVSRHQQLIEALIAAMFSFEFVTCATLPVTFVLANSQNEYRYMFAQPSGFCLSADAQVKILGN